MKKFSLLTFLVSVNLLALLAHADTVCPNPYATCKTCTLSEQKDVARKLLHAVEKLDNAIPTPSPKELEWFATEDAGGGYRQIEAHNSVIGKKRNARWVIDALSSDLNRLIEQIDADGNLRYRLLIWVNVASILSDPSWVQDISSLRKSGVGGLKQQESDSSSFDIYVCSTQASLILRLIVKNELQNSVVVDSASEP